MFTDRNLPRNKQKKGLGKDQIDTNRIIYVNYNGDEPWIKPDILELNKLKKNFDIMSNLGVDVITVTTDKKVRSKWGIGYFKNGGVISQNIWDTETN